MVDFWRKKEYYSATSGAHLDLFERLVSWLGFDPHRRYGPNHGAPLADWFGFGLVAILATGTLLSGVIMGG